MMDVNQYVNHIVNIGKCKSGNGLIISKDARMVEW